MSISQLCHYCATAFPDNKAGVGEALGNIGRVYSRLGEYSKALEFYQQSLAIFQEIGDRAEDKIEIPVKFALLSLTKKLNG